MTEPIEYANMHDFVIMLGEVERLKAAGFRVECSGEICGDEHYTVWRGKDAQPLTVDIRDTEVTWFLRGVLAGMGVGR